MRPDITRSWYCNGIFVVLVGFLAAVVFPDRSSKFDYDLLDQTIMDSDVPLARHRDPLRMKIDRSLVPDMLELAPTANVVGELEARAFIDSQVLPLYSTPTADDARKVYEAMQGRILSPLQATMMLMGCYGYVYGDAQHHTTTPKTTASYLQESLLWRDYSTPFMLQALEDRNTARSGHDKSACSCMKDFAQPTLVSLKDDEKPMDKAVQDKLLDTCSLQNTIDYTLNAASANVLQASATKDDLSKAVLLKEMSATDASRRQRSDPLKQVLNAAKTAAPAGAVDEQKLAFITAYCNIDSSHCTALPVATSALATLTNAQLFDFLLARVDGVHPHNKLRPPKLCSGVEGDWRKCEANLKHEGVASVSAATYSAYIEKYRHAFHMCSRAGVPQYTTLRVGRVRPHRVYNIGQCFLFLAALFAFTWSFMVLHYIDNIKAAELDKLRTATADAKTELLWEKSELRLLLFGGSGAVALAWIFLIVALVRGWFWNGSDDDKDAQANQIPHETDGASTFFIVFFWLVGIGFIVVFTYLQMKFFEISRSDIGSLYASAYGRARALYNNYRPLKSGAELFATTVLGTPGGTDALGNFNEAIVLHLQSLAPYAQVALDLSVIAGLTTLAVASVAQRGVQDINVISTVSLWFLAIGLIAHLSNMLRLIHVYLQFNPVASYSTHVQKAAHHRLYVAVLLALMLFLFTVFAGMDSGTTTSSHAVFHQMLFAIVALFVLCGTDVVEHVVGAYDAQKMDRDGAATTERFWRHVSQKNYFLAWILVLALVFLHLHRSRGICEAAKGRFSTSDCLFLTKY